MREISNNLINNQLIFANAIASSRKTSFVVARNVLDVSLTKISLPASLETCSREPTPIHPVDATAAASLMQLGPFAGSRQRGRAGLPSVEDTRAFNVLLSGEQAVQTRARRRRSVQRKLCQISCAIL